jgi:uncharacterized membrane protein YdjX (TVP38/TMEM64 family)
MAKKVILAAALVGLAALFWVFDLHQYLTLDYIKQSQAGFQQMYAADPVLMLGGYMLAYILITALSLPGAAAATLAGGALFGFWPTLIAVSFASSIGASLACFFARFVLRDWVQNKFGDKLEPINRGIEQEGAFYLFTLRLAPIFPFFIINLVMGLTRMPLWTFYWVSQAGMLAGTAVFVYAGRELGRIDSLSDILSPGLIASFIILGLFPLTVKKLLGWRRARAGRA